MIMAKNKTRYDVRNPEILHSIVNQGCRGLADDAENINLESDLTDISDMRPIGMGSGSPSSTSSFTFTDEDDNEHENLRGLGFSLSRKRPVQMNRQRSKSTTASDMRSKNSVAKTPYSKSRQTNPRTSSNVPKPSTGDPQFEYLVSMLSSLKDDVRASNKNQEEFQHDMGQFKTSIEERLKRLEDLEADKVKQPDPPGLNHGEQKQGNRVPANISRYIGHVYGTSPGLTYNPADPFRSRRNQEVKMRLMDELKAKFAESSCDKELHNAAYNRYKNARQKHTMEQAGKTEELLNKRKCNVFKHRKLNARRKACETEEEREYWDGVGIDLMSDEENAGVGITNVTKMNMIRSRKLESEIQKMDNRRKSGKNSALRIHVIRDVQPLKKNYSNEYIR